MPAALRAAAPLHRDEVLALYAAVGWRTYTADPDGLVRALEASPWVLSAWDGDRLVGLLRALTDDVAILYIQDLLVHPDHQGQGIGRALLQATLDRYHHVRQKVLLTEDEPRQHALYTSVGLTSLRSLKSTPLHAFVRIEGVELA